MVNKLRFYRVRFISQAIFSEKVVVEEEVLEDGNDAEAGLELFLEFQCSIYLKGCRLDVVTRQLSSVADELANCFVYF